MKTLALLLTVAGIGFAGTAVADQLDVRQLIEQRWMAVAPTGETWTCAQADASTIRAAFDGKGASDLTVALNDDPRPDTFRGPIAADLPVIAYGQ